MKAWLVAGGTGGHIFPAQAVAETMLARSWRVRFVTDARGRAFWPDDLSIPVTELEAGSVLAGSFKDRLRAGIKIFKGFRQSIQAMRQDRPDVLLGFGGYPVFPVALAARLRGVPLILHEQNRVLGRTNRVLLPLARHLALSFPGTRNVPASAAGKTLESGNPVRARFRPLAAQPYAVPVAGEPFRLLVLGGSLGARVFSTVVPEAIARLPSPLQQRFQIVQQCRAEDLDGVQQRYKTLGIRHQVMPFMHDVPEQLVKAHLVIARAGASTLTELEAVGRPAILVPYPSAMDDHQTANATLAEARGGGWVIAERQFTAATLAERLAALLESPGLLAFAAGQMQDPLPLSAADTLADLAATLKV